MDNNNNMDEFDPEVDYDEPEIVELDGEPFEIIDAITVDGRTYIALVKFYEEEPEELSEEDDSFIVLEEIENDGSIDLATIDDEALYETIGNEFIKRFSEFFADTEE